MRPLILSIFALFPAGCTHSQQSMVDTFRASLFDTQDITVADQQIQALPYSTMYLRLNEGQRIRYTQLFKIGYFSIATIV